MSSLEKIIHHSLLSLLVVAIISPVIPGVPMIVTASLLKTTVFQIAVEIAFILWVFLAIRRREFRPNMSHPVVFWFTLFIGAVLITFPFGILPNLSFWSSTQRVMGVFQYLHLYVFFLILVSTVRTWKEWKLLFMLTTVTAICADIVAIKQWLADTTGLERVGGVFANTLFLAQYAMIHLGIAAMLWADAKKVWERMAYIVIFLLHAFTIILTASRASLLSLFVVFVIGAIVVALENKRMFVKVGIPAIIIVIGTVLVSGIFFIQTKGYEWAFDNLPFAIARMSYPNASLNEGQSFFEIQIADRDNIWGMALEGFRERPITGWGFESFRYYFDLHFDPLGADSDLIETNFDRVHNQYIEILFTTGLFGFIPYMLFWGSIFYVSYKRFKGEEDYWKKIALFFVFAVVTIQFIQLFFLFDVRGGAEVFLLVLAYLYAETREKHMFKTPEMPTSQTLTWVVVPLIILMSFIAYKWNVLPMEKQYQNAVATQRIATNIPEAYALFEESFSPKTPITFLLRFTPLNIVRVPIDFFGRRASIFGKMTAMHVREMEKSMNEYPNLFAVVQAATVAHRQAIYFFPEDRQAHLERASELAQMMIELGPGHLEGYEELGDIAMLKGDYEQAIYRFEQARERVLWEDVVRGRLDFRMAETYVRAGEYAKAMSALDSANRNGYSIFYDVRLLQALVDNFPKDPADLPDGFSFYVAQIFTVQKDKFETMQLITEYFMLFGDEESMNAVIDQMFTVDPTRAAKIYPDHTQKESKTLKEMGM